jgi:hypothetical protein
VETRGGGTIEMPYNCKGKCDHEQSMYYHTRHAEKWCTVCGKSFKEMPELRCYCCGTKLSTKRASRDAKYNRAPDLVRY